VPERPGHEQHRARLPPGALEGPAAGRRAAPALRGAVARRAGARAGQRTLRPFWPAPALPAPVALIAGGAQRASASVRGAAQWLRSQCVRWAGRAGAEGHAHAGLVGVHVAAALTAHTEGDGLHLRACVWRGRLGCHLLLLTALMYTGACGRRSPFFQGPRAIGGLSWRGCMGGRKRAGPRSR